MTKRPEILVGLSFQSEWLTLGETVASLARALGANVHLVHVDEGVEPQLREHWGKIVTDWYRERDVIARMSWESGRPAKVLERLSEADGALMMALGASDVRSQASGFVGGTTTKLLRRAACPVLVVPWASRRPASAPPWRIAYPTDLGELSVGGLEPLAELGARLDAEVHLIHVVRLVRAVDVWLDAVYVDATDETDVEAARRQLETHTLPGPIRLHRHVGRHLDVVAGIQDQIAQVDADLVVIPSHGRGALAATILGSVAEALIRNADRPILVLKPAR